jgi:hypothetical protein
MARDIAFDIGYGPTETAEAPRRDGFFTRLFRAIEASRQRAAEREIERWLQMNGDGRLTDELEREIERRMGRI